ncbi:MAG: GNAT family N-acetyltransferase [Clostridia bacterium]|nr:GNAT family N-acetyltransferase [Clostridia bacterium]
MLLQQDNLTIRNATADDAQQLAAWWNDGSVMAHAGFPNGLGITPEEIAASLAKDEEGVHRRHIIEENGIPIGEMNYRTTESGAAEIGIKICVPSCRNRGLGKKLLRMFIDGLFNDLGYTEIILDTNLNNLRAQHVYESLGFEKVRVNIDSWTDQLGNKQSSVDYRLLKKQ